MESLTAALLFTRSFPPTSSNGEVIRAAKPGRSSSSRQSRVIKTMFPPLPVRLPALLQHQDNMWSSSSAGQSPAKRVWVTCVYVNSRDKVDEWHTSLASFAQLWDQEDSSDWLGCFPFFFPQLWLICVISSLSSLSNKNYYNPLRLFLYLKHFDDERESVMAAACFI